MTEPRTTAGRYRKVEVRMWGDAAFRALSGPQPNGKSLWQYLLTGRHTSIIPGLSAVREVTLADDLGWTLEGFREAFREVSGEARPKALAKADWDAGVVWIPKAIAHNAPQSPNVVRSWRATWDDIPECDLKCEAYRGLREAMKGMHKAFLKAFDEAIPDPSRKASGKASPQPSPNQEQEQEQEQEQDQEQEQEPSLRSGDARERAREAPRSDESANLPSVTAAQVTTTSDQHASASAQTSASGQVTTTGLSSCHLQEFAELLRSEAYAAGYTAAPKTVGTQLRDAADRAREMGQRTGVPYADAARKLIRSALEAAKTTGKAVGLLLLDIEPSRPLPVAAGRGRILPAPSTTHLDFIGADPEAQMEAGLAMARARREQEAADEAAYQAREKARIEAIRQSYRKKEMQYDDVR